MDIVNKKLTELTPYENNPRNNEQAVDKVAESIKQFGFKVPIVIDSNGVIVAGHTRYLASQKLKLDEVPCVVADDLTDEQVKAFRLVDNKTSEFATWDIDKLQEELASIELQLDDFGFDIAEEIEKDIEEQSKYTAKVQVPQYEPTGKDVEISDLYDNSKTQALIEEINQAEISDEIKLFLIEASHRHTVFNYKNIAEFYSKASKEVQELMEQSALVIIDFDDAIANGYVKLEQSILNQIEDDINE